MWTYAEKYKPAAVRAKSASSGLWKDREKAEGKSMGKTSPGFAFSLAGIPIDPPMQASDKPTNGGERPGEERMKVVADIGLSFSQQKRSGVRGGSKDSVVSRVGIGSFSQPSGGHVDSGDFGTTSYEASFSGESHPFAHGKCTISAKLDVTSEFGTTDLGRTDVPSATDAVVTARSWPKIKSDLTPENDPPFRSPREEYYSEALVERHEKFHGTDEFDWTKRVGLGIVKDSLEAETVTFRKANTEVPGILDAAKDKLYDAREKYYHGHGKDHDHYSGELRAYADGVGAYRKLAKDVEKQGRSLMGTPRQTKRRP